MFESIETFEEGESRIRARRYGVIEMAAGRLKAIHFRPFPKLLAIRDLWPVGDRYHPRGPTDRCLLYYNQPWRYPRFLALKYVASTPGTRLATFRGALTVLDAIGQIKRVDALLCDAANSRISDRLLARWGWQAHRPQRFHRNYIKRFYGEYPELVLPV